MTSLADALQLSFGVVTTDRRRQHAPGSMFNSVVFERIGTDGTDELEMLEEENALTKSMTPERGTQHQDFAGQSNHMNDESYSRRTNGTRNITSAPFGVRARILNGENSFTSSPLVNSTRASSVGFDDELATSSGLHRAPTGGSQHQRDGDGYEVSDDEGDADEVC